ncbi:MAG: NADH-quinone oxidoreductase subunit N [Desulfuromonadales bacterium]|nr:NADH-quinone oxidoreductase subunit N [Desulfuromonadales bacterium]
MNPIQLLPEIVMACMALLFFGASLGRVRTATLSAMALIFSALAMAAALCAYDQTGMLFFDCYRLDPLSQLFKLFITGGLFLVISATPGVRGIDEKLRPEYFFFLSTGTFGLLCLVSCHELLTMLLSLEIASFSLNVMIPFRHRSSDHRRHMEASIKYFMFGVMSTGIMLYGMSYLFGLAHSTHLVELLSSMPYLLRHEPLALVAMIMLLTGFFFKLSLFPLHFLTPDVYEGAANETACYIATLPKVTAICVLIRLSYLCGPAPDRINLVLATFAVLSMTIGNFSALVQNDIKRMLAYSSIAHAGYVMLGILCMDELGFAAAVYYTAGYLLMNLACFYVIYQLAPRGTNITFAHLQGLCRRSPLLAFTLATAAFGMTGIPPTIGFTGKFLIFTAAINRGFYGLVILAVVNAALSAFFYLKMVRAAYCQEDDGSEAISLPLSAVLLGVVLVVAIILAGVLPQGLMGLARLAVAGMG